MDKNKEDFAVLFSLVEDAEEIVGEAWVHARECSDDRARGSLLYREMTTYLSAALDAIHRGIKYMENIVPGEER